MKKILSLSMLLLLSHNLYSLNWANLPHRKHNYQNNSTIKLIKGRVYKTYWHGSRHAGSWYIVPLTPVPTRANQYIIEDNKPYEQYLEKGILKRKTISTEPQSYEEAGPLRKRG